MKTFTQKTLGISSLAVALVIGLSAFQTVNASSAYTTIQGSWLISQAAGASRGSAPQVVACGDYTLVVTSASPASSTKGTFAGTFTASSIYNPEQINLPSNEQVTGSWMSGTILGVATMRVSFSGSSPAIAGSFASPPTQPAPSTPDPTPYGCTGLSSTDTLFGFVQLPSQGTEGMFIYSTQPVSSFPL